MSLVETAEAELGDPMPTIVEGSGRSGLPGAAQPDRAARGSAGRFAPIAGSSSASRRDLVVVSLVGLAVALQTVMLNRSSWGNSDTHWTWLLVNQFGHGAPWKVSLVDGNRLFPDLFFGALVRAIIAVLGVSLSAFGFTFVYSLAVVAMVMAATYVTFGRSRALLIAVVSFASVTIANSFFLEALRPGYHAMSAAAVLLFVARRSRHLDRPYGLVELMYLSVLCASSRFLVFVAVVPLALADLAARNGRRVRVHRLFVPLVLGPVGWLGISTIPGVRVSYSPTRGDYGAALRWFFDFARPLDFVFAGTHQPGMVSLPTHGVLLGLAFAVALLAIAQLRRGRLVLDTRQRWLCTLGVASSVVGGPALRAGGYLVGWRCYIFVLPLLLAGFGIASVAEPLLRSFANGALPRNRRATRRSFASLVAALCLVATAVNGRATAAPVRHGMFGWVAPVLRREGLMRKVGLTTYWASGSVRGNVEDIPLYVVAGRLQPYMWVVNPADVFVDRQRRRTDFGRRIDYVLSVSDCSQWRCDAEGLAPSRDVIVEVLGEPDRWVRVGTKGRLAVYEHGAETSKFLARWRDTMRAAGLL